MMLTIEEARDCLGVDADLDHIVQPMLDAIPAYIEVTTGMDQKRQQKVPLVGTVSRLLLQSWYYAGYDAVMNTEKLQKAIDSLLKALTVM